LAGQRGRYRNNVADTLRMVADGKAMDGNENPPSHTYAQVSRSEQDRTLRPVSADHDELAAKLEALAKHPELDGAYKQLHDIKQGRVTQISQNDRETPYLSVSAQLSEQLHREQVPKGNVALDESRRVIEMAAGQRGLMVRDAGQRKQDFKDKVVATSSHHALVQVSDMVAICYEKAHFDREVRAGEKVVIQHGDKKAKSINRAKSRRVNTRVTWADKQTSI
jgi:hypothetical protein